jgi:hypothetical protein
LGLAFAAGRASAPEPSSAARGTSISGTGSGPGPGTAGAPAAAGPGAGPDSAGQAPPVPAAAGAPSDPTGRSADRAAALAAGSPAAPAPNATARDPACQPQLQLLREQVASLEQQRRELEGTPVPPQGGQPERYSQAALTSAVTLAFQQSRIPGRIETVDCAEFPCIVYGRIFGDEDHVERLERAKALAPYRGDVMTMLLWTATDEALARRSGEERPERLLFAFAFYSRDQKLRIGDNLDRRIRARTAELWNALRPDDEE